MACEQAINADTRRDLATLTAGGLLKGFYLAGGTGLALHLGHRLSFDLDFFRPDSLNQDTYLVGISKLGPFSLDKKEAGTLTGKFNETLVSLFHYPYPLLEQVMSWDGIEVASVLDIACMKLDAAATRGTRKDFVDLYHIVHEGGYTLPRLLEAFEKKYQTVRYNLMHIKKSLVYFADAEVDPMPTMLMPTDWETVRVFFELEVPRL